MPNGAETILTINTDGGKRCEIRLPPGAGYLPATMRAEQRLEYRVCGANELSDLTGATGCSSANELEGDQRY